MTFKYSITKGFSKSKIFVHKATRSTQYRAIKTLLHSKPPPLPQLTVVMILV